MARIDFVTTKETVTTVPRSFQGQFKLNSEKKHVWLQKICFYILEKLGAHYYGQDEVITYEKTVIDTEDVMRRILEQRDELEFGLGRIPKKILMGQSDFHKLMNNYRMDNLPYMRFDLEYAFWGKVDQYTGRQQRQIMGLELQIIPWMQGVLVMPDDPEKQYGR